MIFIINNLYYKTHTLYRISCSYFCWRVPQLQPPYTSFIYVAQFERHH